MQPPKPPGRESRAGWMTGHSARSHVGLAWLAFALALAYVAPAPGLCLRRPLPWHAWWPDVWGPALHLTGVHALLAWLLFGLGLATVHDRCRSVCHDRWWLAGFFATRWGVMAIVVALGGTMGLDGQERSLGMAAVLILWMPAAGSASGWCLRGHGRTSLALHLILGSTVIAAFLIPIAWHLGQSLCWSTGMFASEGVPSRLVPGLLLCVLAPAAAGVWIGQRGCPGGLERLRRWVGRTTLPTLFLLNYANGSVGLPRLGHEVTWPDLARITACCVAISLLLHLLAEAWSRCVRGERADRLAFAACVSMSNTGLALVLLTTHAPGDLAMQYFAIAFTFVQHAAASLRDAWQGYGVTSAGSLVVDHSAASATTTIQPVRLSSTGRPTTMTGAAYARPEKS